MKLNVMMAAAVVIASVIALTQAAVLNTPALLSFRPPTSASENQMEHIQPRGVERPFAIPLEHFAASSGEIAKIQGSESSAFKSYVRSPELLRSKWKGSSSSAFTAYASPQARETLQQGESSTAYLLNLNEPPLLEEDSSIAAKTGVEPVPRVDAFMASSSGTREVATKSKRRRKRTKMEKSKRPSSAGNPGTWARGKEPQTLEERAKQQRAFNRRRERFEQKWGFLTPEVIAQTTPSSGALQRWTEEDVSRVIRERLKRNHKAWQMRRKTSGETP